MIKSQNGIPIFASSCVMSTDQPHLGRIVTVFTISTTQKSKPVFLKQYLRVGKMAIRLLLTSSVMADSHTLRNMLICLCIYLRFIRTKTSNKSISSPSARLSGLIRYHLKNYETFTTNDLLIELFGTLRLQDTLLYQLTPLLRIDISRNVQSIIESLILIELDYIERLKSSLPQSLESSQMRAISFSDVCAMVNYKIHHSLKVL